MKAVIFLILLVLALVFVPFAVIFTINTLAGTDLPYTFKTWFAAFMVMILFSARNSK